MNARSVSGRVAWVCAESDNRPTRYIVLEELYKKTYPKNKFVSSIETAELEMA